MHRPYSQAPRQYFYKIIIEIKIKEKVRASINVQKIKKISIYLIRPICLLWCSEIRRMKRIRIKIRRIVITAIGKSNTTRYLLAIILSISFWSVRSNQKIWRKLIGFLISWENRKESLFCLRDASTPTKQRIWLAWSTISKNSRISS